MNLYFGYIHKNYISHFEDINKYKLVYQNTFSGISFKTILGPGVISASFF